MFVAATDGLEKAAIVGGFVFGLFGTVVSLLTLRIQRREARGKEAAGRRAALDCELVSLGGGTFRLLIHNQGAHEATDVEVRGTHDTGLWLRLTGFPRITPGAAAGHDFTNQDWQVIGASRFALEVQWTDGEGTHTAKFSATRRT